MTDEEKQKFLLEVVNAKERWSTRDHDAFVKEYREWFPAYDPSQLEAHMKHYAKVRAAWLTPLREIPVEREDGDFGLKVVILRHQLRVLWVVQSEDSKRKQDLMLSQVAVAINGMGRQGTEGWRSLQIEALRWLDNRNHLSKMKVCKWKECSTHHTFFLRDNDNPNQQYCCVGCGAEAKRQRNLFPKDEE